MSLTVTTPSDTEIEMRREFEAPPDRVFAAMTRPDLLPRWYGARGWNLVVCEVDLRVGGRYRFVSCGPGDAEMGSSGVYREIVRPSLLVYTEEYDDHWYPGESLVRTELEQLPGGRTVMTTTMRLPNREVRDAVIDSPMERGVGESYARLDVVLATTEEETR